MLLPDQATYSTVQYGTVQYSTHHPAPHELLGLDESVCLGLGEGEGGAGAGYLQPGDLHPGHLQQSRSFTEPGEGLLFVESAY